METTSDASLLNEFVKTHSEAAFSELVHPYVALVHSAAARQVGGDVQRAQDVTQAVFCELARKAPTLLRRRCLAGWLYNTARFIASRQRRSEARRSAREHAFSPMQDSAIEMDNQTLWIELRPVIDDAMQELNERDREAVLLRFFQDKPLTEIAVALRLGENAARMRVDRALEKLRTHLSRRGIKSSASVLGTTLTAQAVVSTVPSVAAGVIGPALAGAALTGGATSGTLTLFNIMTSAQMKAGAVALALAAATAGLLTTKHTNRKLAEEVRSLRGQAAEISRLEAENLRLSKLQVDSQELARLRSQMSELARLRAEVSGLRRNGAQFAKQGGQPTTRDPTADDSEKTPEEKFLTAKSLFARDLGLALRFLAFDNEGQFPTKMPRVLDALSASRQYDLDVNQFELLYKGSLRDLKDQGRTILAREKEPVQITNGRWHRIYVTADGGAHRISADTPDGFDAREKELWPGEPDP